MGYNGREFQEPYTMSNGEDLIGSMSNLHVGEQSTSGSSSNPPLSLGRTNLNPNAAEFVPMAYKAPEQSEPEPPAAGGGVSRLNRTNSINSNASDDEYRKFCRAQLPDDLMPDFDFGDFVETNTEYEEQPAPSTPDWTGNVEQFTYDQRPTAYSPRFEGSTSSGVPRPYLPELRSPVQQQQQQQQPQPQQQVSRAWNEIGETGTSFTEWGSSDLTFPEDLTESVDPITILATEFPGFASESLAEIYYANGGDLALTVDMLSELELQNQAPPAPAPPSPRDFPALAGLDVSGRSESRAVPDFAAAVRKQAAAQQAAQLQFERNGGVDLSLGAVRGLTQGPGFSREARVAHNERLVEPFHVHEVQAPVAWLETGDSVANLYADMREEARDHARVRNAYFDQARQAYLTGNKALAKELSAKGQWHNEQMKAAHNKAGEAIYWQRNSNAYANSAPGQRLIDLHGLHVGEAIPLLKREIAQMRYNVRSSRQRETVFICVGTGHHTKGSRTPSRLPAAVQRYLLEEEHLQFTEPQAGMLRIIIR